MTDKMSPRGREQKVTNAELIKQAKTIPDPCFKANEVSQRVSIGDERTRQRLEALTEEGVLESKSVGSGTIYWFRGR